MKKIIIGILVYVLIFSTVVVATSSTKMAANTPIEAPANMEYSHTIFAELGTSTACKFCKYAHAALKNIYAEGTYPFYYISLVTNNAPASERINFDYNKKGLPTVFFDGGYKVNMGASDINSAQESYEASIIECGNREVLDIDIYLQVEWIENAKMDINVSVKNNEAKDYDGYIRVYVTEKSSSLWSDTWGYPYTFAFLDYAFNEDINILSSETWQKSTIWDGEEYDFGFITCNNVMVFAAVFNSEWHQGYADPPNGNPFDAYYVDEATAASPPIESNPPDKPTITGNTSGKPGVEHTFEVDSTDPDGDQVYYWFEWGDRSNSGWLGPFDSGATASASHTWTERGSYEIKVKAKDVYDLGSDWETLQVTMPKNKLAAKLFFYKFFERFYSVIPILRQLL